MSAEREMKMDEGMQIVAYNFKLAQRMSFRAEKIPTANNVEYAVECELRAWASLGKYIQDKINKALEIA